MAIGFGKGLLILAPVTLVAYKLAPALMAKVAATTNDELYLLVALALGFATAAVEAKPEPAARRYFAKPGEAEYGC